MRILLLVLLFASPLLAAGQTPAESFQAFVDAVIDEALPRESRVAIFDRYFDFEAWLAHHEAAEGRALSAEEREQARTEWFSVFLSDEFRRGYRARQVRIEEAEPPAPDAQAYRLPISMKVGEERRRFEVRMTRADGWWRWWSIPQVAEQPEPPKTPAERLAEIDEQLEAAFALQEQLERRVAELRAEKQRVEAEIAEARADEAPFSSPMTTARSLGRALIRGDAEAVLAAHTRARREVNRETFARRVAGQAARIANWEPLDSTLVGNAPRVAMVRVRVTFWTQGGTAERVITLTLREVEDRWLVDEQP